MLLYKSACIILTLLNGIGRAQSTIPAFTPKDVTLNPTALQSGYGADLTRFLIGTLNKGNSRKRTEWSAIGARSRPAFFRFTTKYFMTE